MANNNNSGKLNFDPLTAVVCIISLVVIFGPYFVDFMTEDDPYRKEIMAQNGWIIALITIFVMFPLIGATIKFNRRWIQKTKMQDVAWPRVIGSILLIVVFVLAFTLTSHAPELLRSLWEAIS